jgi:hemerythrin
MAIFVWKEEYRVDEARIDSQHKRLFEIAGRLHEAMRAGEGRGAMAPILDELIAYTRTHFGMEESLMRANGYPGFAAHRAEHEGLTERVLEFRRQFGEGRVALTVEMLHFLRDWLVRHIGESDRRFGGWLRERAA